MWPEKVSDLAAKPWCTAPLPKSRTPQAPESRDELVLIDANDARDPANADGENAPSIVPMRPGTSVYSRWKEPH